MRTPWLVGLLALAAIGCGNVSEDPGGTPDGPPSDSVTPDSPPIPEGYSRLIGRTWTVQQGGRDIYRCARVTIPQDMYITNIQAQAPLGTHHTVLSIVGGQAPSGPDGVQDCGVNTLGTVMLYASGVGTSPLDFPQDVGIKIAAGTQIHLNLHLYNGSDDPLNGDSAILVKAQATPPPILAEMVFAGKFLFQIPANPAPYSTTGGCTVGSPYTLFAVWPHMHKLATHQKVELVRGGVTTVLHDQAFDFAEQKYYLKTPEVQVQANDRIRVTCTWSNTTGAAVTFGDSSDKEMCFSGMYRYPAAGSNIFQCTDTGGAGF